MPFPSLNSRAARSFRILTVIYLVGTLFTVLTPIGATVGRLKTIAGVWIQGGPFLDLLPPVIVGDVMLNILAFIPLTLLPAVGWPHVRLWAWGVMGSLVSVLAETLQGLIPALHRRADVFNIIENSAGAWIGVWMTAALTVALAEQTTTGALPAQQMACPRPSHQPAGLRPWLSSFRTSSTRGSAR